MGNLPYLFFRRLASQVVLSVLYILELLNIYLIIKNNEKQLLR